MSAETEPTRSWCEKDGVIYFSVTSDGTTGEDWITRLESKGFRVGSRYIEKLFRSKDFKPTKGITTTVAVLKSTLFNRGDRDVIPLVGTIPFSQIEAEADERKLMKPNPELACLIREFLTDEEIEQMGMWDIVIMHEQIRRSSGNLFRLIISRDGHGCLLIGEEYLDGWDSWEAGDYAQGFAFAVSETIS